ncbi:MAG: 4-hydroxy-tetrahydrodipicolinate synthase [Cyclobacteriaceae bacterium]
MTKNFTGTGVALVTPMHEDGSIDYDGLARLIEHVIAGGVDYLVALGTTGESPTVYPEERAEIIKFIAERNNGRKPLVVGFSGNFTHNLVSKLKSLNDEFIDGVLISSPHYNKPSQEGLVQHYIAAADASKYPIILYNVPHRTSSNMTSETTLKLAEHPQIVAIKEASGDLVQCEEIIKRMPKGFSLISGDDGNTADLIRMGGSGVISVVANAYPKSISELVNNELQGKQVNDTVLDKAIVLSGHEGNPTSIKAALYAKGVCGPALRLPLTAPSDKLVSEFKELDLKKK